VRVEIDAGVDGPVHRRDVENGPVRQSGQRLLRLGGGRSRGIETRGGVCERAAEQQGEDQQVSHGSSGKRGPTIGSAPRKDGSTSAVAGGVVQSCARDLRRSRLST